MLVKSVNQLLDDLAAFEPVSLPVISLYLNTQPNERGRADFEAFVRKEMKSVAKTYPGGSPERASVERDIERIIHYVSKELGPEANGADIQPGFGGVDGLLPGLARAAQFFSREPFRAGAFRQINGDHRLHDV
jgi:hypothetical protein